MPRYKARAVYALTAPDGHEVGAIFETQGGKLVVRLDPAFHETARSQPTETRTAVRLAVEPISPTRRCG